MLLDNNLDIRELASDENIIDAEIFGVLSIFCYSLSKDNIELSQKI